jgi:adenylate cyclase
MTGSRLSSDEQPRRTGRRVATLRALYTRPGFVQALTLLAALLVLAAVYPNAFEEVRLRVFDLEQRLAPRPQTDTPVVIVAIDEASLKPPLGQWPWPRTLVAALVRKIGAGHPSALGVDILFAEPDRFSPANVAAAISGLPADAAQALAAMPSNDAALGEAVKAAPTVLGMGVTFAPPTDPQRRFVATPIRAVGGDPAPFLPNYPALIRSQPEITAGESGQAVLVGDPDRDGILRRVPLFVVAGGNLVAGLSVETLRVALGQRGLTLLVANDGIEGARVGGLFLPTDARGRAYPYFTRPQPRITLSAADVLAPSFDPQLLEGQIVLLGVTGLGLVDLKQTPLGLMPGIEVQAQLVQSMVTESLLRRPAVMGKVETAFLVVVAIAVLFFPYRRHVLSAVLLGAAVVICLGMEFAAFRLSHLLLDGVFPAVAALLTFGVMLSANLRATEAARHGLAAELEHERELKARLEGELNAARAIQMGLLPRPLPRVPETSVVEVHALIETARMVGGDLYDFVMLDPYHLFFAIADVSGKGVDAALFMAMTKMLLGSATVLHGDALDLVFDEANVKIALASDQTRAEGGRPMFVTVFAAVLELASGRMAYASAGHDSPYLLRAGSPPQRIDTEGGPPLGTLDEFLFPVDIVQLSPGDVLLLYTDGVTEAKDEQSAFFTSARLDDIMASVVEPTTARAVVELVRENVRRFVGGAEQADDITILGVRWLGAGADPLTAL